MAKKFSNWFKPRRGRKIVRELPEPANWAVVEARRLATLGHEFVQPGPAVDAHERHDCGNCRFQPRIWIHGRQPKSAGGECGRPAMFPAMIERVDGRYWSSGKPVEAGCSGWEGVGDDD